MNTTQLSANGTVHSPEISGCSNGVVLDSSSIRKDPDVIYEGKNVDDDKVSRNFTISFTKKYKLSIYKPLIPLKLALFLWYGAGATVQTFLLVFFTQKGITLNELSLVYILSPIVQFFGPTICGIIADKIGRSKPILVVNLLIAIVIVICMLAVPRINVVNCDPQPVNLKCHHQEFGRLIVKTGCDMNKDDIIELVSCNVTCPENVTQYCNGQNLICEMLEGNENFDNLSLSVHVNWAYKLKDECYYNVTSMSHKNGSYSWCNVHPKMYCRISCKINAESDCSAANENRTKYLIMNMAPLILFFIVFSNSYRFMDVTSMCLVKEHNSDFGRERFFAVAGILLFSPLAGYFVDLATPEGSEKNYDVAFYAFIVLICVLICNLYYLDVTIRPPGKNMWKKSMHLLKDPDNIGFLLVLTVLGTSWSFTKNFTSIFLGAMGIPGFLLGLVGAISALYGLPFLLTSNWWVKKFGTTQIFILGLLGYVANGIGFSFLYDPWLALIIEATSIVTYHLLWVAVIVHSHSIAPEGLIATVIAAAGGVHYSIGKGLGGLIGGLIMGSFGARIAYRVMASICLVCAVLYALFLYVRRTCFTRSQNISVQDGAINATDENEGNPKEIYVLENKS